MLAAAALSASASLRRALLSPPLLALSAALLLLSASMPAPASTTSALFPTLRAAMVRMLRTMLPGLALTRRHLGRRRCDRPRLRRTLSPRIIRELGILRCDLFLLRRQRPRLT
jgi:hypothetical protein